MKALHTADWHLGTFRSPVKDGVNLRTEDTKRCLDEMIKAANKERPDYSLISGDVFHVGRLWSDRCCEEIIMAIHYIKELAAASKEVVIMRGTPNHDGAGPFKVLSEKFESIPNVHVVTTPQVLMFEDADIAVLPGFDKGTYRANLPGLSSEQENEAFTQELSNIIFGLKAQCRPDKASILMAHYTVPGCNAESSQSMMLTRFEPIIQQETLLAADYSLVALGHIHRPQRIGSNNWFYSGAINQLNFNDEGQERGFWIHNLEKDAFGHNGAVLTDSQFFSLPAREHITFDFTDTDITAINLGHIDEVAFNYWRYNGAVQDKIVRIRYSCTEENAKAYKMKDAVLEKTLLEDGAFMLWENLPLKVDESANRAGLENTTDPELNLIKYLEEKEVPQEKIEELILKARPIIAQAEASMTSIANTGTFEPVEISVKNYRNYEEETFNFEDITFCTINGQNGAGKSSLFMDAIIDCLYEEPREGIIKDEGGKSPWLRNDEKVRSGSIMFTFRIGEKKYRVTRTRARSGKGTLNLAEFVENDWEDRSKERYNDTQQEILDILGMDSFTFKSCALIMQDQYGLFLQARPEERIEVLGTLLGLGIYQAMERIAQDKAKENGAKARDLKQKIDIHNATIESFGKVDDELEARKEELAGYERSLKSKTAERDQKKLILANQKAAAERRNRLLSEVSVLWDKKASAEQSKSVQQGIVDSSTAVLSTRTEIEEKAAEYRALLEKERMLERDSTIYSSKKQEIESLTRQVADEQEVIVAYKAKLIQKENDLLLAQPTDQDVVIEKKAAEYSQKRTELEAMQKRAVAYQQAKTEYSVAVLRQDQAMQKYEAEEKATEERREMLEKKVSILSESGCVDISNARCKFLQDAVEAKDQLAGMEKVFADIKARKQEEEERNKAEVDAKLKEIQKIGFDASELSALQNECTQLSPYIKKLEDINQRKSSIALLEADIKHLQSNIAEAEKRLSTVKLKGIEAEKERDRYVKAFEEQMAVRGSIMELEPYLEKEKQIPVAEERNTTARTRILELTAEIKDIDAEITEKQGEADKELEAMGDIEELYEMVRESEELVDAVSQIVKKKQMQIGALQQKADQISDLKDKIADLQKKQMEYAKEISDYETLKTAFSQSGVPHQIIRSIIPQLTAISNNILGQMTGGKTGVEFRLERMQKNGKEKVSLDIFIEEYGKSVLPYLSKSGGEKVKSSLSVILALAEIKSSFAGIQLGMLFIDEPPFLDSDGIEAYVEALETIKNRYSGLKIMAITHDKEFKTRFPESVTVIKDENGSHVMWD